MTARLRPRRARCRRPSARVPPRRAATGRRRRGNTNTARPRNETAMTCASRPARAGGGRAPRTARPSRGGRRGPRRASRAEPDEGGRRRDPSRRDRDDGSHGVPRDRRRARARARARVCVCVCVTTTHRMCLLLEDGACARGGQGGADGGAPTGDGEVMSTCTRSGLQQVGSTWTTSRSRSSSAGRRGAGRRGGTRCGAARRGSPRRARYLRRHASWLDMACRETPSASARLENRVGGAPRAARAGRGRASRPTGRAPAARARRCG